MIRSASSALRGIRSPGPRNVRRFIGISGISPYRASKITKMSPLAIMVPRRNLGFIKILAKATRVPAYIGGTMAAGGTYVAYKVEQASTYTQDKLSAIKDFSSGVFDKTSEFFSGWGSNGGSGSTTDPSGPSGEDTATVMGATAAAVGLSAEDDDGNDDENDDEDEETLVEDDDDEDVEADRAQTDEGMLTLTRQMIEIRNLLASIDHSDALRLPQIVVIGSQSSGKSSVLEAIVGHEFLPKGSNMVTRRPIELTLINTPDAAAETADFPALKMHNMSDFDQVQKVLVDLNLAVPLTECISPDPIQITIRSPRVPDLSLVDLPGYIQVEAADQPAELKSKIRSVCDRYLTAPNIILAIQAANVDLANSTALRAAKMADPRGERTIGVVTKLDLVEPDVARSILVNKKYPLRMGYVGVITRPPDTATSSRGGLFSRKAITGYQAFVAQQNFEHGYFKDHKDEFYGTVTSTRQLKKKLIKVLERSMAAALKPTHLAIQQELEETSYQFKVEFNDRPLTPQMYLANNIDMLKLATKELAHRFSRRELRSLLQNEIDQKVLDLLAERYWNQPWSDTAIHSRTEPPLKELSQLSNLDDDVYWHKKLDLATSSLTKLGIGRFSTTLVTTAILTEIGNLVDGTQLRNHPLARKAVIDAAESVLSAKYYSTADQVENCIKPFKYEIETEDREWLSSKENAVRLLKEEMRQCDELFNELKREVGGRKLSQVMTYLTKWQESSGEVNSNEALGFSGQLIQKGREALFLKDRLSLLQMRHSFVKSSKKCRSKENKYQCPEIFLDAVSNKLSSTAILFLNVELLSDFYYKFPRELDRRFFGTMTPEEMEELAKEDPKVKKHIELGERKDRLETALSKMESVMRQRVSNSV
ncbi:hypothetical protein PGUG_04054 [Meyerozyma guilliermondii ATCC 6260]|uniref:dynamin GTPase n=1 Tax=Meyerozyma guilliermondii (strain ATCC 6260 / CBS 566 / DSM 6381 / JCM 1539 / NBRC 10279 / NRRL Y-324) TaxID=294746 RepID=A5DLA3_PICGU|nr:uncharacterized protein PGUG_04054 [Meyerozyma guilliermondii ATCC 6260]EDK39956.2 hypothetical protein PGUG_04054 [Meyerozyma guilliermondii ATCC 6260]